MCLEDSRISWLEPKDFNMPRDSTYEKTVYILGAGFSIPAGGPSQDKILEKVIDLSVGGNNELQTRHRRLLGFLESTFKILPAEIKHLSLEDLYTPIGRCLADRVSFRGKSQTELEDLRSDLDYLISRVIKDEFDRSCQSHEYVDKLATFLVKKASHRAYLAQKARNADEAKKYDPFSIISLNWDILSTTRSMQPCSKTTRREDLMTMIPLASWITAVT